jgi:hypothetical protein
MFAVLKYVTSSGTSKRWRCEPRLIGNRFLLAHARTVGVAGFQPFLCCTVKRPLPRGIRQTIGAAAVAPGLAIAGSLFASGARTSRQRRQRCARRARRRDVSPLLPRAATRRKTGRVRRHALAGTQEPASVDRLVRSDASVFLGGLLSPGRRVRRIDELSNRHPDWFREDFLPGGQRHKRQSAQRPGAVSTTRWPARGDGSTTSSSSLTCSFRAGP